MKAQNETYSTFIAMWLIINTHKYTIQKVCKEGRFIKYIATRQAI